MNFWFVGLGVAALLSIYVTFAVMGRASKGYAKARERRVERGPAVPCSTCGSSMEFVGLQEFRMADEGSAIELGAVQGALPVEFHKCPTCRKMEFFLPPSAG